MSAEPPCGSLADEIRPAAQAAAARHRPKGFSAEVTPQGPDAARVVVRYCWSSSPRFEVRAEVIIAADEVAEAIRALGSFRISPFDYLADHECVFTVTR